MSGPKSKWVMIALAVLAAITVLAVAAGVLHYLQLQKDIGGATLENLKSGDAD